MSILTEVSEPRSIPNRNRGYETNEDSEEESSNIVDKFRKENPEYNKKGKTTCKDFICLTSVKGTAALLLLAILVPVLVYIFFIDNRHDQLIDRHTCLVNKGFRVSCGEVSINKTECEKINCCFDAELYSCFHFLPSKYNYMRNKDGEFVAALNNTPYGTNITKKLSISIYEMDSNVKITLHKADTKVATNTVPDKDKKYQLNILNNPYLVEIARDKDLQEIIFSTANGPLISSETFWEWTIYLTNEKLYGLDRTLIKLEENATLTRVIYPNLHDHSVPVFWAYKNKKFHGVIIRHEGPLEITVTASNLIILRGLMENPVEIEVAMGPSPRELRSQVKNAMLYKEKLLKTHLCRSSSSIDLTTILNEYNEATSGTSQFDSDCIHENLFMALQTNKDPDALTKLQKIIQTIRDASKMLMISVPPMIYDNSSDLYTKASELGILYKHKEKILEGKYLGNVAYYPDFGNDGKDTINEYMETIKSFIDRTIKLGNVDGFVLTDNWPLDENYKIDKENRFPYFSKELSTAFSNTIPWDAEIRKKQHITEHNNYGFLQYQSFVKNFPEKLVISASNHYGGYEPQVLENVKTSWTDMKNYLQKVLFDSIIGEPMVSVPICGSSPNFSIKTQEQLCLRWYLISSNMPFLRIASGRPWRDPYNLNITYDTKIITRALHRRQTFLPYYNTILANNKPVLRPMFYSFYEDNNTLALDEQFMIGNNILTASPFVPDATLLKVYLPPSAGTWYEFMTGDVYNMTNKDGWIYMDFIESDWISFIAQGSVIPLMETEKDLNLKITLDCQDLATPSLGSLIKGSQTNLTFEARSQGVNITGSCPEDLLLQKVDVYGCSGSKRFTIEKLIHINLNTLIPFS